QKSQGAVTEEMRQRLEGMEWLLREMREREFTALAESVAAVQGRVDELTSRAPEWAETLAEHIELVGQRVKPLSEIPALRSDVRGVSDHVTTALDRIRALTEAGTRTHSRLEGVAGHLERLSTASEERFETLGARLDAGRRSPPRPTPSGTGRSAPRSPRGGPPWSRPSPRAAPPSPRPCASSRRRWPRCPPPRRSGTRRSPAPSPRAAPPWSRRS